MVHYEADGRALGARKPTCHLARKADASAPELEWWLDWFSRPAAGRVADASVLPE